MSDSQENRVRYPLIAGLVLVGGSISAMMIWSANHTGKSGRATARRLADASGSYSRASSGDASNSYSMKAARGKSSRPSSKPGEPARAADTEDARVKELIRKLEEPKKDPEPERSQQKEASAPPVPPAAPAQEKSSDRSGTLSPKPLSPEDKMVEVIRAFIVRQLAHPDGFDIVDHTKPQRVKAVNKKPAQLMRVVFRAQDGLGRAGAHDFLFVVQDDEVVEHAPTAVYVAAQRARQQAMLQVALANEALLQQQLRGSIGARGGAAGGGCVLRSG